MEPSNTSEVTAYIREMFCINFDNVDVDFVIKNGHVIFLFISHPVAPVIRTTESLFNYFKIKGLCISMEVIKGKVRRVQDSFNSLKRHVKRNWLQLKNFLHEVFNLNVKRQPEGRSPPYQAHKRPKAADKENMQSPDKPLPVPDTLLPAPGTPLPAPPGTPPADATPARYCARCCPHRSSLISFTANLKQQLKIAKKEVRVLKRTCQLSRMNQELRRKNALIEKYREEKKRLKKANFSVLKESDKLRNQLEKLNIYRRLACRRKEHIDILKKRVSSLKASMEEAAKDVEEMNKTLGKSNSSQGLKNFRQGKSYDAPFRKSIYACLVGQVPVEKAGHLVRFILHELTQTSVSKVPAPSTIAQMAYEMGVMSNLQLAENLYMTSESATLAWDATTIEGAHYNEINISLGDRTFTLEVGKLSGGATVDYFQHIGDSVKDLGTLYAIFSGTQQHLILHKIQQTIQTTLSDRAPVNNCVSQELGHLFCKQLVKLNCNLHPLDGLATEAKKTLKIFDGAQSKKEKEKIGIFGQEGRAANLVYAISKLRYKTNSGDPASFKSFLKMSGLTVGVIARYVGNRLHILFHSAGVIYHLQGVLLMFLKKYSSSNPFRLALIEELQQPFVMTQLRVLGLFGKMLTGPWMTVFYENEAKMKHVEMIPVMKSCVTKLQSISLDPECLLHWTTDCFERPVNTDDQVLRALRGAAACNMFREVTKSLSEAFCRVLERQLFDYLEGTLSVVTDELRLKTSSAPLHNIHSERALGMFDSQCHRSRNSTVGFKEGKLKFTLNKTMDWLMSKPLDQQHHIIAFCRRLGAKERKSVLAREAKYQSALRERLTLMAKRREEESRRKLERSIKDGNKQCLLSIPTEANFVCNCLLINSTSLIGRTLHHIWAEGNVQKIYRGTVKNIKDSNIFILYDGEDEVTKLSVYALVADIVLGNASFA